MARGPDGKLPGRADRKPAPWAKDPTPMINRVEEAFLEDSRRLAATAVAFDDAHGHEPCVGPGPHCHPSVEARGGVRVCWACWAKGVELALRAAPPARFGRREQDVLHL